MARLIPDTSALVKLYRNEPNSPQVRACVHSDDTLLIAQITSLEIVSAFSGLVRQNLILPNEAASYIRAFRGDLARYQIISADVYVFQEAERLLDFYAISHNLRPPDSLQLASALVEQRNVPINAFLTTDKVLCNVAKSEGLTVLP